MRLKNDSAPKGESMRHICFVLVTCLVGIFGCGDKKPAERTFVPASQTQATKPRPKACPSEKIEPVLRVLHFGSYNDTPCEGTDAYCDQAATKYYQRILKSGKKTMSQQEMVDDIGLYLYNWPTCTSEACWKLRERAAQLVLESSKAVLVSAEEIRNLLGADYATFADFYRVATLIDHGRDTGIAVLSDRIWNERTMSSMQYEKKIGRMRQACEYKRLRQKMPGIDCEMNDCFATLAVVREVKQQRE